jgi:hypothetical protein
VDKAKLLAKRGPSYRDVEVDVGTVRVRGLNRVEVKACKDADDNTSEVKIVAAALVDPEGLTEDEVAEWLEEAPAGDYVAVMQAISELSGLSKESAFRGVPGA